jgi:integrase
MDRTLPRWNPFPDRTADGSQHPELCQSSESIRQSRADSNQSVDRPEPLLSLGCRRRAARRNPVSRLERLQVIETAPTELSDTQRLVLKNLVERSGSQRVAAIFALAYWAGLRISEIAQLKFADCDVNKHTGTIIIHDGKGGETRTLDLHSQARRTLREYLYSDQEMSDARDPESLYVFTSQRAAYLRQQGKPDSLSTRGIEHLWDGLKRTATREEWEHIHKIKFQDLRHDWAHRARAAGWTLEEIAVYAGHQTKDGVPAIRTTVRYTLPSRQQLRARLQTLEG